MRKLVCLLSFALALVFAPGATSARSSTDEGWYWGFSFGKSRFMLSPEYVEYQESAGLGAPRLIDESGASHKLMVGNRMTRNFGLEFSYVYWGRYSWEISRPWGAPKRVRLFESAICLDAVGFAPVGDRFALFGKVGIGVLGAHALKAGVGAEYFPQGVVGLRLEFERVYHLREDDSGSEWPPPVGDIRFFTLGVTFRF